VAPSSEDPKQLPPPAGLPSKNIERTIDARPATIPVQAGSAVIGDIGNNNITNRAEQIRYSTDEAMVWQEAPSLALLAPRALKYAVALAVVFAACAGIDNFVAASPGARAALEQIGIHAPAPAPSHRAARKLKSRRAAPASDAASDESPAAPTLSESLLDAYAAVEGKAINA
jgi:hypothetical protein